MESSPALENYFRFLNRGQQTKYLVECVTMVVEKQIRKGTYGIQKAKSSQGGDMKVLGLRTLGFGFSWLLLPPSRP